MMPIQTYQSASGAHVAVAAGSPNVVEAARQVLDEGGNVVDAATAAAAAACVVMPHMTGLGGDLFALVAMAGQPVVSLNSTGAAPMAASIDAYRNLGLTMVPDHGGLAVQSPGAAWGLEVLAEKWGTRSLADLLVPAMRYARDGFAISHRLAGAISDRFPALQHQLGWREVYAPNGLPIAAGSILRQERLGESLAVLASEGARGFAASWVGEDIADVVRQDGGLLTHEDIMRVRPEVGEPLHCRFQGYDIYTQPPVSQGFILLRALSLLERQQPSLHEWWPRAAEALAQAFGERLDYLRDDADSYRAAMSLLSADPVPRAEFPSVSAFSGGNTTALAVMDAEGNAASVILSLFDVFGSGVTGRRSGIVMNNRLSGFFLDGRYANSLAPGRRSMHTLHSYIAQKEGVSYWAGGSPGADVQPQANLHVLLQLLAQGVAPAEAVSAPRWVVTPGTAPKDQAVGQPFALNIEPGLPADTLAALRGLNCVMHDLPAATLGSSKLVGRMPDGTVGAWTDCRREGAAYAQ